MILKRSSTTLFRHVSARPRFYGAAVIGALVYKFWPYELAWAPRILLSWDIAVLLYLVLIFWIMLTADDAHMLKRAQQADEGRAAVLGLSVISAIASFVATAVVLSHVKQTSGGDSWAYATLAGTTIFLSWTFIHVMFTEHYAHEYYLTRHRKGADSTGLKFPDDIKPNYVDFLYFAFTIGVANQTADIAVTTRSMRGFVLLHSVISYTFNTLILALMINIASNIL